MIIVKFAPELKPVIKHASHDQSSHGSWAGKKVSSITKDMANYFGKDLSSYRQSQGYQDVQSRTKKAKEENRAWENHTLEIVAEKQGFTGTPKVVSAEEMDRLEEEGWTIAYRGISDYSYGNDGSITSTSQELAEEFRTGDYHAGSGVDGDGIYLTTDYEVARSYADDWPTGKEGTVLKVAIPPNSTMDEQEFNTFIKGNVDKVRNNQQSFWGDEDIGTSAVAEGYRGAQHRRNLRVITDGGRRDFMRTAPVYVIWDRSMLAVQEADK